MWLHCQFGIQTCESIIIKFATILFSTFNLNVAEKKTLEYECTHFILNKIYIDVFKTYWLHIVNSVIVKIFPMAYSHVTFPSDFNEKNDPSWYPI